MRVDNAFLKKVFPTFIFVLLLLWFVFSHSNDETVNCCTIYHSEIDGTVNYVSNSGAGKIFSIEENQNVLFRFIPIKRIKGPEGRFRYLIEKGDLVRKNIKGDSIVFIKENGEEIIYQYKKCCNDED